MCVCLDTGTMAAAVGREDRSTTGRCSEKDRLQRHGDKGRHESNSSVVSRYTAHLESVESMCQPMAFLNLPTRHGFEKDMQIVVKQLSLIYEMQFFFSSPQVNIYHTSTTR